MTTPHFLVVGGTGGIGRELVRHLSRSGWQVSVLSRRADAARETENVTQYTVDVRDHGAMRSCLDAAVSLAGKFRALVFMQRNRGGVADFEGDLAVALGATRSAIDHVVDRGHCDLQQGCSIVIVSSVADRYVAPEQPLGYHIAKAGLAQLTRYYALRLGPAGIRVNAVSPCVVLKPEAARFYEQNAGLVDRYRQLIPLGRMGRPQDIVDAIMFLSGESATYITGQNLVVDGGLTLRSHESLIRDGRETG